MTQSLLLKFLNNQDWYNYLKDNGKKPTLLADIAELRKAAYKKIEDLRKRPLIIYATSFLDQLPPGSPISIDLSDVDGFTDLVNSIPKKHKTVDVLLHSPGGKPDATERIVNILRRRFKEVHFIVPHSAYSAATMLALSGNTVTLHGSATLGPIDPQLDGIPARSIKRGFEKVREIIKKEGAEALPPYIPLIEKYSIHLLEICDDSEKLAKDLVSVWLNEYMFEGKKDRQTKSNVRKAVKYFSDYDRHLLHARPITFEKIKEFGLKVEYAPENLEKAIWEAYILINGFFNITPFVKLFENSEGVSWGRQVQQVIIPQPNQNINPR